MKTSNIHLLREIDSIEELFGIDASELFVVKEIDTLTEQVRQLRDGVTLVNISNNMSKVNGWDNLMKLLEATK